ncbi:GH36-type glycosyl hydrolase domain-containing protein [Spirosoma soli]|uniref:GH36-type glycosyl hydrolase domain-containing protein n=1 Tax=Spirosoma soli TaxID=1770529 RepID=A0ABW5M0K3_9BACT
MKPRLVFFLLLVVQASYGQIGAWHLSSMGLPVYEYKGLLPVKAVDKTGKDAMLPNDPYFLLGNYKMTLFAHASGRYQFLTGERAWARINAAEQANYGWNDAELRDGQKEINLVGIPSTGSDVSVKKRFGVGFARYEYPLEDGLACTRIISVKPSQKIHTGNPAFVVTVTLTNKGNKTRELTYSERMLVNFVQIGTQFTDKKNRPLAYQSAFTVDERKQTAVASITCAPNTFLTSPTKEQRYQYDIAPPAVFMHVNPTGKQLAQVSTNKDTLTAELKTSVKPGETQSFYIIIGIRDSEPFPSVQQQVADLLTDAQVNNPAEGLFAAQWKRKLPDLSAEKDELLKREMLWNAHMVEASAKYSAYYQETFIPQGTVYAYHFGDNISNRDHLQAALPACYTNPALAKSSIRYVMKHSEEDGEIKRGNAGYGYTVPSIYKESDEQLFLFNTLSEYLLITKDYSFLNEKVPYYPAENGKSDAVLSILKKQFIYLRDEVGRGSHGLVKMLNSDWSDSFFHKYSPNLYASTAESHLNSAMVLAIFPKLISALKQAKNPDADSFITALESYRSSVAKAYFDDFGNRQFSARAYLNDKLQFGVDNVCLEPQGYLLQIPDLPEAKKKEIYQYVKSRNFSPEQTGFRIREKPLWSSRGDGEDGAIWYSLEYPVLLGVATFDKAEAMSLLHAFSFQNYATHYPDYWVGQWTAPDDINSTLSTRQGLYSFWEPDIRRAFQGYCNHPHTWPLFCYFKLKEQSE